MNKALRITGIVGALVAAALAFLYLLMTNLYSGRFGVGVWVNDVYATGLTAAEVTRLLDQDVPDETMPEQLLISTRGGKLLEIPTASLKFYRSYRASVRALIKAQNPLTWFRGATGGVRLVAEPEVSFDVGVVADAINGWELPAGDGEESRIEYTAEGYQLALEAGEHPDRERMIEVVSEKIAAGEYIVSLDREDCYTQSGSAEQTASLLATWEAIEETRLPSLCYRIGDERIALDAAVTDGWLLTGAELHALTNGAGNPAASSGSAGAVKEDGEDAGYLYLIGGESVALPADVREVNGLAQSADGELIIKEEELAAFVHTLCERYDTLDKTRSFTTADGRVVQVPAGTYGNKIDEEAEVAWLKEAVISRAQGEHVPALTHEAKRLGSDDIGDTYVEVDIGRQTLYYFVNGRIDTETPVVTGNVSRRNDTPPGVYDIYFMQRNRTLRGEGYTSFVNYWIAFYGNYGIHDATWRSSFGEEIYRTAGSHGCVNIPYAEAGPLYQKLVVGTPVIVHE